MGYSLATRRMKARKSAPVGRSLVSVVRLSGGHLDTGKPKMAPRTFTPLKPLYEIENAFARLGMWQRLSRCFEQAPLGAKTWLEVACLAYWCGRLRVEPT